MARLEKKTGGKPQLASLTQRSKASERIQELQEKANQSLRKALESKGKGDGKGRNAQ